MYVNILKSKVFALTQKVTILKKQLPMFSSDLEWIFEYSDSCL